MSKMSDMAATIEELRNAAAAINDAANWLAEAFSSTDATAKAPAAEPALKLEDVRAVLAEKSAPGIPPRFARCFRSTGPTGFRSSIPPTTSHCSPKRRC
jgi:hypothetical protein